MQQSNKFRINAACTSCFFRLEIYYNHRIVVFYDAGIFPQTKNSSQKASKRKRTDTHDECLSFSRKEDCEYGYYCTTYIGNGAGIFGTIIILCRSQAASTPMLIQRHKPFEQLLYPVQTFRLALRTSAQSSVPPNAFFPRLPSSGANEHGEHEGALYDRLVRL